MVVLLEPGSHIYLDINSNEMIPSRIWSFRLLSYSIKMKQELAAESVFGKKVKVETSYLLLKRKKLITSLLQKLLILKVKIN